MIIDFPENSSNSTSGNDPLPEGRYSFKVTKAEFGHSPDKGTPKIDVWTKVTNGKYEGKTRIMNFYITKAAVWKLQSLMTLFDDALSRGKVDTEEIVKFLESNKPEFSAYAKIDGSNRNDFSGFTKITEDSEPTNTSQGTRTYDDLPF